MEILVNASSCVDGGTRSILIQFLESAARYTPRVHYTVFAIEDIRVFAGANTTIVPINTQKRWLKRMCWDLRGIKRWAREHSVRPDMVISLQNTGISGFRRIPQIVYLHQSLPFTDDIRWSLKKNDRLFWFYHHVYRWLIQYTIPRHAIIVVQTEWMREAVLRELGFPPKQVFKFRPNMPAFDPTTIRPFSTDKKSLFFPISGALPYKNTELLLHAARWLYENRPNRDYRFAITLRRDELSESQQALWIDDIMEPLGKLPYEDILRWYATAHALVFPSRIETFGLPLVEGMCFGLPILVADVPYAREVCTDYPGAVFLPSTDAVAWGRAIATHLDANAHFLSGVEQVDDWEKLMSLIISHADKEA